MPQPMTGIVTAAARLEKNPDQVKRVLRGYLRSLRALRQERQEAVRFIGGRFSLDAETAEDVYKVVLQTMSEDGTMGNSVLERYLDDVKKDRRPIGHCGLPIFARSRQQHAIREGQ